jgi:Fe-S-cluster containining protein
VELANEREALGLEAAGVEIDDEEDGAWLIAQPCTALRGKRCSIYAHRPKCCRTFECLLLKRFQGGELSLDAARQQIGAALELKKEIEKLLSRFCGTNATRISLKERCAEAIALMPGESVQAAQLEKAINKFESIVRDSFLGKSVCS